jgi:xanthine/CO dehydrogenase XdhC/CoxF family maturation factor
MPQIGNRKIAKTNFTQRVGTVSGSDVEMKLLDLARATLRTTFPRRSDLRAPRLFFDFCFRAAKVVRRLRRLSQAKARKNRIGKVQQPTFRETPISKVPKMEAQL